MAKYGRADKDHYSADADSDADNADNVDHDQNNKYGDDYYDDDNRLTTVWGR